MQWQNDDRFNIYVKFPSEKPIENNRNKIVLDFIEHPEFEYLIMIDDDVVPPANYLDLLLHDKDIISGVCFAYRQNGIAPLVLKEDGKGTWNVMNVSGNEGLIEVHSVGTGAIMIHRRVFDNPEMRKHPFESVWDEAGTRTKGLDLYFCEKARKAGFRIWCHMSYICSHIVSMDLKETYNTMVKLSIDGGALNDNIDFRTMDNKKIPKARNKFILSKEQRSETIHKTI